MFDHLIAHIDAYFYSDWAAFIFTILWIYYTGEKKRIAFLFAIAASLAWLCFGILTHSMASIIANSVFVVLNIQAYIKWGNDS